MAINATVLIGEYPGSSEKVPDASDVLSLKFSVKVPTTAQMEVTGRRIWSHVTITKPIDKASPGLAKACITSQNLRDVKIAYAGLTGDFSEAFYRITLENCRVTDVEVTATGEFPTEAISFAFQRIELEWVPDSVVEMDQLFETESFELG